MVKKTEKNEDKKAEHSDVEESNWKDLADHFRDKVSKRVSEVAYLQTRAGFIIAASVILLQMVISQVTVDDTVVEVIITIVSFLTGLAALVLAVISMHISRAPTPLNPDEMILTLTEQPSMTRRVFSNWLAKSYAKTNTEFNKQYDKKYTQQIVSAILIVITLVLLALLKGLEIYV